MFCMLTLPSVAALAFLVWHAILTFDEEVEYIWPYVPINSYPYELHNTLVQHA